MAQQPPVSIVPLSPVAALLHSRSLSAGVAALSHYDRERLRSYIPKQHHQARSYQNNNGYLPNGVPDSASGPGSHQASYHNNHQAPRVLQSGTTRILCVADVRGAFAQDQDLHKRRKGLMIS